MHNASCKSIATWTCATLQKITARDLTRKKARRAREWPKPHCGQSLGWFPFGTFCHPMVDNGGSKRQRDRVKEEEERKQDEKKKTRREGGLSSHSPLWPSHGLSLSLSQSLGTTSSCRLTEREMLGGRAEDSDMWNLSSNADPLCFRVLVFSPPIHPLSPSSFFFSSNSLNMHKFSIFSFRPPLFHFPSLTCDACTPVLLLQ